MSTTRIRAAIAVLAAATVVCSGALTGCAITRDEEPRSARTGDSPDPEPTAPATEEATEEPSESPSATPSTPASSAPPAPASPAATPEAALLTAAEMPQLNSSSAWTERRTGPVSARPFGLCQKFDLLSVGAMTAVERTFTHETDTAGQQVAEFPDAQTAVRAGKVVEAWHRDCASRVRGTDVRVRPITDVPVAAGTGWWYLASFERRGTGHFHSLGMVLSGTRMTLLRMDHDGQDHNYDPGQDPMQLAVATASAKLG
jgi:hypothetical protein